MSIENIPHPNEVFKSDSEQKMNTVTAQKGKSNNYRGTKTPEGALTFDYVAKEVEKFIPNTTTTLKVALAVATSGTRKNNVMLWMLFVGVPSSGKTEIVELIRNNKDVLSTDVITLNAFVSGERTSKNNDLLPVLANKCFVIKDWTVIFSLDERACKKIIGDMVAIYDKVFSKHSPKRGTIEYDSEFSHLGCITPATLNKHTNYLNMIGARFLHFTPPDLTEDQMNKSFERIFEEDNDRDEQKRKISVLVSEYLKQLNDAKLDIKPFDKATKNYLKIASQFMSRARGIIILQKSKFKNESGDDVVFYELLDSQIEQPWRAAQQLMVLAKHLAFVSGKNRIGYEELEIIRDVVTSTMPADRAQALQVLRTSNNAEVTAKQMSKAVDKSTKTARRLLQELTYLGICRKDGGAGQTAATYAIADKFRHFICMHPREFLSDKKVENSVVQEVFGDLIEK